MLKLLFFAGLLSAAPSPAPPPDGYFKIPLPARRLLVRADGNADAVTYLNSLNNTLKKYNYDKPLPPSPRSDLLSRGLPQKRQSSESLTDQVVSGNIDELYYGPCIVGATTPQTFTLDFDTGKEKPLD